MRVHFHGQLNYQLSDGPLQAPFVASLGQRLQHLWESFTETFFSLCLRTSSLESVWLKDNLRSRQSTGSFPKTPTNSRCSPWSLSNLTQAKGTMRHSPDAVKTVISSPIIVLVLGSSYIQSLEELKDIQLQDLKQGKRTSQKRVKLA